MGKELGLLKSAGKQKRRGGKQGRNGGPRLSSFLLKAIGVSENGRKASVDADNMEEVEGDVYEYEEGIPEEERGKNKRFDDVERFEYELPSDFEDEEIDEEAAFGGDDEGAGIGRVSKKMSKEVDLNSDEDDEDDQDDEDSEDDIRDEKEHHTSDTSPGDSEEEEEDEDEDDEKHRRMIESVTGKSENRMSGRDGRGRKERVLVEAYPESEFNLNPSAGNPGITIEDLMAPLHDTAGFGTLRKRMQQLQKRGAPVPSPLPRVIQERLDRKAGYEKTCEDITKWQPIVKRNREAPSLVFNKKVPTPTISTAALAANFKPTTQLERDVHSLLNESKLADVKDVEEGEALELNKLTVDEVRERQERLAKMRHLLFRHESKAKRVKKIKSKTYHRLLQKSKVEVGASVGEADPEAAKEAALKQEFKRAQERMTLKHKNNSRWAKRILKRGLKASEKDGKRDAIAEQLRTHAALTKKVHSATLSDTDDASTDSEEEEDVAPGLVLEGMSRSKVLMKAKAAALRALEDGEDADLPSTGLFALPFMQRAIEKRKKDAQNEAMAILEQLEQAEEDMDVLGLDDDYSKARNAQSDKAIAVGRITFGGQQGNMMDDRRYSTVDSHEVADVEHREFPESLTGRVGSPGLIANNTFSGSALEEPSRTGHHFDEQMKFLSYSGADAGESDQSGRVFSVGIGSVPSKPVMVSIAGTQKKPPRKVPLVKEAPSKSTSNGTGPNGPVAVHAEDAVAPSTFSDDSDADVQGAELFDGSGSQQALIRQAFAGDDVEAEFERVKSQALDEEVSQGEGPVSLPGWGQWSHIQKKKGQPTWLVKEQEMLKQKRDATLSRRKDAKLKHVIISEKQDKKAAKFTTPSVPFPFSSREVFERSIRLPIGRDFNTDKAYQDMIRPAVIKSAGVIIDPLELEKSVMKPKEKKVAIQVVKRKRHQ